jgi:hypothetical protein
MKKNWYFLILLFLSFSCNAQIFLFAGSHESIVRNRVLQGSTPIFSFHFGAGIIMPLRQSKIITLSEEIGFIQKGYNQKIGADEFKIRFEYLNGQTLVNYKLNAWLTAKSGVNYALLIATNVKKGLDTYRHLDVGLVGGFNFFDSKTFSFYANVVYGLVPMLRYYDIDAKGNFNGTINDLKNTCISVGIRINLR